MSSHMLRRVPIKKECLSFLINKSLRRYDSSYFSNGAEEYDVVPKYPQIRDHSHTAERRRKRELWPSKFRKHPTVEEKLIELNMPKYWGWPSVILKEEEYPYNFLPHVKCATRTHVIQTEKIPQRTETNEEAKTSLMNNIKDELEEYIKLELTGIRSKHALISEPNGVKSKFLTKSIINQLNKVIIKYLSKENDHILSAQVDFDPRIEAFWLVGGLNLNPEINNLKNVRFLKKKDLEIDISYFYQYLGRPILQLRVKTPLSGVVPHSDANVENYNFEKYPYSPTVLGYECERRHGTCIPGFWTGDSNEFSLLSYHYSNHVHSRPESYGKDDKYDTLQTQAVLASYGWLLPLACYQGFTPFDELTYPLVNQCVLTDGQEFMFTMYQLNTVLLYNKNMDENKKVNLCWTSPVMKLYEEVVDGKLIGFNEEVVRNLLDVYLNKPQLLPIDFDLKPYLGKEVQRSADYDHDEKREWLEKTYKHLVSNRPRHRLKYEIYDWEKIYKIQFQTRPLEAKRRPFEVHENPLNRRLDDHVPAYIPRALRPDKDLSKRRQQKYRNTYYPK